ncbi:MAG: phosphohistidine phosphatase SixA [Gammaproteobacteria bacterium]|nr:phosphohistidine phosphatase SixA [Gammaproteobacteria bacterium]MBT4493010.1 phosphohistidine phosphatase SixA [Gammaproteobacteria bacterium]MBT7371509.1 phosphohistidine phosphatase SixA [Gammaproteobacteria bacterium]
MNLLLMRHGEAEQRQTTDYARSLTAVGCGEVLEAAALVRQRQLFIDRTLVSPYVRARQTADLMVEALGLQAAKICSDITPDSTPVGACHALEELLANSKIALAVMHQPIISQLILYLTGIKQPMATANIVLLEVPVLERECCDLICVL